VAQDSLDKLKGLITVSDVLTKILKNTDGTPLKNLIAQCLKEPLMVPESLSLMKLLDTFRTEGVHETMVLDEYGNFSGIVTLHDIMEEIVGLMPSGEEERKEEENRIVLRSENTWLIDGLLDIDEYKEYFHIDQEFPGEEDDLYKTMGGFLTYLFGRIPRETDKVIWGDYIYEVVDMDNTRIDKILVTYQPKEDKETAEAN
ncbi:MAG: CBS domain-containing protein, partial [Veillonella sp.]|nr:CBS domain-containing protein [Veillonella sp.]